MSAAAEKPKAARDQDHGSWIQHARGTDSQPQFLQIVAKPSPAVRKIEAKPEPKLTRVAFTVSRLMEFCSKRELQNQTGHSVYDWPLVVAKELLDNALDAAEEAEVAPVITVIVEQARIIVQDNAKGIDAKTIEAILDYTIRVSSREAYVSPTRGAQGNALKTILAMGYVLQGAAGDAAGVTIIESRGVAHRIEFRADHIACQRKILNEVGCSHQSLAVFFGVGQVNHTGIARLLASMKRHSKPVAPHHLGVIGATHFKQRFLAAGGAADTFQYQCRKDIADDGIPYVIEFGFGLHQAGLEGGTTRVPREFVTGANWSAAIGNPFRRFGNTGEGLESTLARVRANAHQPVICALHLASARIQFADRGKSSIILDDAAEQPDD